MLAGILIYDFLLPLTAAAKEYSDCKSEITGIVANNIIRCRHPQMPRFKTYPGEYNKP
jgi:hypothetical protein